MVAIYVTIGFAAGVLLAWLVSRNKAIKVESEILVMRQQLEQRDQSAAEQRSALEEKDKAVADLQSQLTAAHIECERSRTMLQAEKEKNEKEVSAQRETFNAQMRTMQEQFVNLAQQVLDRTSEKLKNQNNETFEQLTRPLKNNIDELHKAIQHTNDTTAKNTASLSQQLREMAEQTNKIDSTATRLANVIRGGNKLQGVWGEQVLKNILDAQGFIEGVNYEMQTTITDEKGNAVLNADSGKKMIPDAIIHYPNNEDVVIDSKTVIDAYSMYVNTEDEESKKKYAAELVRSIRTQASNLAKKEYNKYIKAPRKAINFVIMFVPHEGALQLALQTDPKIWTEAFDKQVFITSQQNLIAILRMIQIAWRQYAQSESQKKVFDLAEELLKRVGDFIKRFDKVGSDIDALKSHYDAAVEKVQTGRQSIVQKANELKSLGVKESVNHPIPRIEENML